MLYVVAGLCHRLPVSVCFVSGFADLSGLEKHLLNTCLLLLWISICQPHVGHQNMTLTGNIEESLQIPKELNSISFTIDGGQHCFAFEHKILPQSLGALPAKDIRISTDACWDGLTLKYL